MAKPVLDIERLSPDERLDLLEKLWESLTKEPGGIRLTEAQREDLDRRLDELDRGQVEGIPWDEVLKQIRKRSRRSHPFSDSQPRRIWMTPSVGMS